MSIDFNDVIKELKKRQKPDLESSDLIIIDPVKKLPTVPNMPFFPDELKARCSLIRLNLVMKNRPEIKSISESDGKYDILYHDESKYSGTLDTEFEFVQGTITYPTGHILTGTFKNGLLDGPGETTNAEGVVIAGTFVAGCLNGEGKMTNGTEIYEGTFVNNILHGMGRHVTDEGSYTGLFENGDFKKGTFIDYIGTIYEGAFSEYRLIESDVITFKSKNKIVGKFDELKENSMIINNKTLDDWCTDEVLYWIKCYHSKYYSVFYDSFTRFEINGYLFRMLNETDYDSLEVPKFHLRILLEKRDKIAVTTGWFF